MAHTTTPDSYQTSSAEKRNAEELQKADEIWHQTVDSVIEKEETSLKALQTHMQEMCSTLEALEALPDKVSHDVMVPFGGVAMFPGRLVHTNEAHMQLSPSVSVQTSTKHASQVLERRKKWVQEQQDLVQQQLDAMRSRKDFAAREKADEGEDIRDIVEMYDEELHGSLDTPAVRTEVHQQRQYFGPPRTTEEQAAHDHALQQARIVASQVAEEEASSSTADTALHRSVGQSSSFEKRGQEQPLAGRSVYQTDAGDADSDDEDGASEQQPVPRAAVPPSAGAGEGDAVFADEHALNEEVDRLMMALQGTTTAMAAPPEASSPKPLIEEIQADRENSQVPTPPQGEGDALDPGAVQSQYATGSAASIEANVKTGTKVAPASGLKGGFFNRNPKPKKGILKKTEPLPPAPQATARDDASHSQLARWPAGADVARQLVQQDEPSDSSQVPFNGFVRERDLTSKDTQETKASDERQAPPKRVSKFKARMAAERESRNT